jgi:hypothetical protein
MQAALLELPVCETVLASLRVDPDDEMMRILARAADTVRA